MVVLAIFAILLGLIGIIGSIVPGLPGPPLSWLGLLLLYFCKTISLPVLLLFLAVTIIVSVLDYTVPASLTRKTGASKYASIGSIVGLLAGIFFTPIGMISGCLLGAFLGEYLFAGNDVSKSVKASLGAFGGFLIGTGLKLMTSAVMMYFITISSFTVF